MLSKNFSAMYYSSSLANRFCSQYKVFIYIYIYICCCCWRTRLYIEFSNAGIVYIEYGGHDAALDMLASFFASNVLTINLFGKGLKNNFTHYCASTTSNDP